MGGPLKVDAVVPREQRLMRRYTRRDFIKWSAGAAVSGTLAGMGVLSAMGIVRGPEEPVPEWEIEPGIVDYSKVPGPNDLDKTRTYVLKVAQWYDYWPGSFLQNYKAHMLNEYGLKVEVQWDVYTSNEELFTWLTINKRRYDLIFPSNTHVDLFKNADMIYTLNRDWIPNFVHLNPDLLDVPRDDPYDLHDKTGDYVSVPYFWGTTGIGIRKDKIPIDEAKVHGMDMFWMDTYEPQTPGFSSLDMRKKMNLLDDQRDVLMAGFKKAGWQEQIDAGLSPTGMYPPNGPQWTTNV